MKNNLRDKFRDFLASEEGRVGVKAPLIVGIAGGSLLLAQAMLPAPTEAHGNHQGCPQCPEGQVCQSGEKWQWSPDCDNGPDEDPGCMISLGWHFECVDP